MQPPAEQPPAGQVTTSFLNSCFFTPPRRLPAPSTKTAQKVLLPGGAAGEPGTTRGAGPAELLTAAPPRATAPARRAPPGPEKNAARPRPAEGTCSPLTTSSPARRALPPLPPQRDPRRRLDSPRPGPVRFPPPFPQAAGASLTILRARNRPTAAARAPTTETATRCCRRLLLLTGLRTPLRLRDRDPASCLSAGQSAPPSQLSGQRPPPTGSGKVQGPAGSGPRATAPQGREGARGRVPRRHVTPRPRTPAAPRPVAMAPRPRPPRGVMATGRGRVQAAGACFLREGSCVAGGNGLRMAGFGFSAVPVPVQGDRG